MIMALNKNSWRQGPDVETRAPFSYNDQHNAFNHAFYFCGNMLWKYAPHKCIQPPKVPYPYYYKVLNYGSVLPSVNQRKATVWNSIPDHQQLTYQLTNFISP